MSRPTAPVHRQRWKGLDQVNAADLKPGDTVLFRRGDAWRGQLLPKSGKAGMPVTYGAYGTGPRPLLLGSVSRDRPADWHEEGSHVWATGKQRAPRCRRWATSLAPLVGLHRGKARVRSTTAPARSPGPSLRSRSTVRPAELRVTISSFTTPAYPFTRRKFMCSHFAPGARSLSRSTRSR